MYPFPFLSLLDNTRADRGYGNMAKGRYAIMKDKRLLAPAILLLTAAVFIHITLHTDEQEKPGCVQKRQMQEKVKRPARGIAWFISSLFEDRAEPQKTRIHKENYIRDIILEKETACIGEDIEVYVEASNPAGLDSNLYYQIGTAPGNPAVVRFGEEGTHSLNVIVKDFTGTGMESKEVSINVVQCGEKPLLSFKAYYSKKNQEILEFEITGHDGLSGSCRYTWDFGDGTSASTREEMISHDYRGRKRDRYISSFIVTLFARDNHGKTAQAKQAVSIPNIHYISNQMGNHTIPSKYSRFPELRGNTCSADVTLYNIYDEEIRLTEALMIFTPCFSKRDAGEEAVGVSSLLKQAYIPANGSLSETISIDRSVLPESTCVVGIQLTGSLGNDKEVKAEIYLDIPPSEKDRTTANNDQKITDISLIEKLNRAEKILGKGNPITKQELARLEKEGKL